MIREETINKKKRIEKLLKENKDELDIINKLRTQCDRIDFIDENIILNFENEKFEINKIEKKIKKITFFDKSLNNFKEIRF